MEQVNQWTWPQVAGTPILVNGWVWGIHRRNAHGTITGSWVDGDKGLPTLEEIERKKYGRTLDEVRQEVSYLPMWAQEDMTRMVTERYYYYTGQRAKLNMKQRRRWGRLIGWSQMHMFNDLLKDKMDPVRALETTQLIMRENT